MGFFKKVKKKFKKVANVGKRATAAVVTAGLSETSIGKNIGKTIGDVLVPTSLADLSKGLQVASLPALAVVNPAAAAAQVGGIVSGTAGTTGGIPEMSLGNVLGGLGGILSTVSKFGGPAGTVAEIGSGFLSGFLPAQGPLAAQVPQSMFPQATMTMAAAPIIRGAATAVGAFVAPVLAKMSQALGKNITLRAAMIIVRRLGKTLGSPQAIATAVGLSVAELSSLLTASAIAGSSGRRMNVGNVKALRRAHRRIKGFHKLCGENDRLRAPRRRSTKVINVTGRACN